MHSLLGVHHVAIICSDYERAKDFYHRALGLPIVSESYRAERSSHKLNLALPDGTQLEIFSFPSPPRRPSHPEASGLRHLALRVTDLTGAVAWLLERHIPCEPIRIDPLTMARFTFFADPDGLPIELYESDADR